MQLLEHLGACRKKRSGKLQGERRVGDFAGFAIRPNKRVVCACDLEYFASVEEVYPILFDRYIVGQVNVKAGVCVCVALL